VSNTQRTATEQLLVSNAIDQSVSQLDFRILAGKTVYFDAQYLASSVDHGYVVSSLRQHLLACGCVLTEERAQAAYVVEARSGGIGTDLHQLLFGIPAMNLPSILPGQPSLIPEIPFAKKTDQRGIAKIAVFAYNRQTGRPVWQSGVAQAASTSKDTWVFGAGPFRRGTIGENTEFAGQQIAIPLLSGREKGTEETAPVVAVTQAAAWEEPTAPLLPPCRLTGQSTTPEAPKAASPTPSTSTPAETVGFGAPPKTGAVPGKAGETDFMSFPDPLKLPGYKPESADDPGRAGATTNQSSAKEPLPRKKDAGSSGGR
jgi:hypothetical protein